MRLNDFATLQRGERIEVKRLGTCGFDVFTIVGEPKEGNTLIDAVNEQGKSYSVYFRDVIQRRTL